MKLEKYINQILIYELTQDNSLNSTWDSFVVKCSIKNDNNYLQSEQTKQIKYQTSIIAKTDVKLLIPVLKITFTNIKISIDKQPFKSNDYVIEKSYQEFLLKEILVGGFLIIKNISIYDFVELNELKAHITWTINKSHWKSSNLFKSATMHLKLKDIEDLNGNSIFNMKALVCHNIW